jgi:sulfatase maturation enzyme AslB (radical SAM superfamily)
VTILAEALSTGSRYMGLMDIRRRDFFAQNPDCVSCDYLRLCGGGCRANANTATGSVLGRDPITCSFFKDGWAQKVVELVRGVRSTATLVRPESTRPHAQRGHRD